MLMGRSPKNKKDRGKDPGVLVLFQMSKITDNKKGRAADNLCR